MALDRVKSIKSLLGVKGLTMKQCLDVFYLNRRNTTVLEEKLYVIS